jgi:hypothetical protein
MQPYLAVWDNILVIPGKDRGSASKINFLLASKAVSTCKKLRINYGFKGTLRSDYICTRVETLDRP